MNTKIYATLLLAVTVATGCAGADPAGEDLGRGEDAIVVRAGAVYTSTNAAHGNDVVVYRRLPTGALVPAATYATGGRGSGDGLGSQGALALSTDRRYLFVVSAGSSELSVFRVNGETLRLIDVVASGGVRPVSVTEHGGLVYVVHAGDGQNGITGFRQGPDGSLAPLAGSTRALSGPTVGPAEIAFSPSGRALVVTEKGTNRVDEFRIHPYTGRPGALTSHASNGQTPFGFAITRRGQVVVSEAFGGADDASAVSSYQLDGVQGLATVSASVPDTEGAACWVALAKGDRFAYVTNTKSGTVSAYAVATDGQLTLVDADGRSADTGASSKPTDLAVSRDDRFLYVLESGTSSLAVIGIDASGALTVVSHVSGLPTAAAGLVAQ